MMMLASSDAAAEKHARLLSRRPNLRAASLLRWLEWEGCNRDAFPWQRLLLLQTEGRDRATHELIDNLTASLRSLVIGEFGLTGGTVARLGRCAISATSTGDLHASNPSIPGYRSDSGLSHTGRACLHTGMVIFIAGTCDCSLTPVHC